MVEGQHRFGKPAIDELNGCRPARRLPANDFALLMIGLITLLVLLYVQIAWWELLSLLPVFPAQTKGIRAPALGNVRPAPAT
jgi:hypothetical protein